MKDRPIVPIVLLIATLIVAGLTSRQFLDPRYLLDTSTIYVEIGLAALAMTFVIATGNIDLSVASNLVLCACLAPRLFSFGWSTPSVVVGICLIGSSIGAANGWLVSILRVPSFLITLGSMAVLRGAAQALMGPKSASLPPSFCGLDMEYALGMPWPLVLLLFVAACMWVLFHRSVFGRWVVAVGENERAAHFVGLPVSRIKIAVFALSGLMAAMGGLLLDSRLGVARHDLAKGLELEAITVAVVGGAAIQGGRGSIIGTLCSLFLVMALRTAMGVAGVKSEYQLTAVGAMLILAVSIEKLYVRFAARGSSNPTHTD